MPISRLDLSSVTTLIGVYALCDLDEVPFYVGQTISLPERGIRGRVRRHITSARSDIIANRQIDVWEIAYVWAWPVEDSSQVNQLERQIYELTRQKGTLVAGKVLPVPRISISDLPSYQRTMVRSEEEIAKRRDVVIRLPRQLFHIQQLLDVMLDRKDTADLRYSLNANVKRLAASFDAFERANSPDPDEEDE